MKRWYMIQEREKAGLTQQDLASRCSVSRNTISNIENCKFIPGTRLAIIIFFAIMTEQRVKPEDMTLEMFLKMWD